MFLGLFRVFPSEASYRHMNQGRWGSRGPTPPPGAPRACPRLWGFGHPVGSLRLYFMVQCCSGKIITLAFVPSNSENIDFLPFWNQKQKKTGNWHCGILLILLKERGALGNTDIGGAWIG